VHFTYLLYTIYGVYYRYSISKGFAVNLKPQSIDNLKNGVKAIERRNINMKNKQFKELSEIENKAVLCGVITKKTGKLSKEQIKYIVDNIDLSLQYTIKVTSDAKEFAKEITMIESGFSHSWAGSYGKKEIPLKWFWWGNVEPVFGLNRDWEYSDNGSMREPDIRRTEPNFDTLGIYCIIKEINEWDNFNNSDAYDKYKHYMIFYIPESEPYKIDDKN
jgi:hypothetical protein